MITALPRRAVTGKALLRFAMEAIILLVTKIMVGRLWQQPSMKTIQLWNSQARSAWNAMKSMDPAA